MILVIRNRQRVQPLDTRLLRKITTELLTELIGVSEVELGIALVSSREMAAVNQSYLQHEGSTDVITFDHVALPAIKGSLPRQLHGELFICVEEAMRYAKEFRTTWQLEVVRYVVHGVLHLCGYDDLQAKLRREMKREEVRLLEKELLDKEDNYQTEIAA